MTPLTAADPLTPLAWDTDHFGFPVARIGDPDLDDTALDAALNQARQRGVRLVYWQTTAERVPAETVLEQNGGWLADRKVTFARSLIANPPSENRAEWPGLQVREYPKSQASSRLLELAIAAGEFSRYRLDPRMPRNRFVSLYETWMDRSARGELAEAVLTVVSIDSKDEPVGMVTLAEEGGSASIGLIAVLAPYRGRKVGAMLMDAAHQWMHRRGATLSTVVTQQANEGACAFYRRSGYHLRDCRHVYHFWPPGTVPDFSEPGA